MNNRRQIVILILLFVALLAVSVRADTPATATNLRQRTSLDSDWLFHLGDITPNDSVIISTYDDAQWQHVEVPNDYVLDGTFSNSDKREVRNSGYLTYQVGWYRKRVVIPEDARGKILRLDFDGVFRDSQVWLNGQLLGRHQSGYTPFSYDITKVARIGGENLLAVRVDPRQFEGHWYEGGGIYRHVFLTSLAPVHMARWGTYVISKVPDDEKGAPARADLTIQTKIENSSTDAANCQVISEIIGPDGASLKTNKAAQPVPAASEQELVQQLTVDNPKLWSIKAPNLYQLRTTILQNDKAIDSTTTTFGIRTLRYDPNQGFFLNGQRVEIQGLACHQDFAGLGIAVPDALQEWRVRQLQKLGCNAWRTAHNPTSESLLDACDRLGMMVMDENRHLGNGWGNHTSAGEGTGDLSDLAAMIQRDRNHPSIIMWSLCNEEGLRGKPEGRQIFAAMKDMVHRYDQTRPVTCAINGSWLNKGLSDEDIIGINYHDREYDDFHRANPNFCLFGSEATNQKTTRGEYADDPGTCMCSAYNLSKNAWLAVISRPFIAGSFTWTGFDYRGEPNPHGWPDVSNNTGLLDLAGFPKDKAYYFQSCWTEEPMVHLVPDSWNWPDKQGQPIRVIAFANAPEVELFLNGQSFGKKVHLHDDIVEWQVPYAPGDLTAKAFKDGKEVAAESLQTTTAPAEIIFSADRTTVHADAQDALVVPVSIVDSNGRPVPGAANRITFNLTGPAKILGTHNGNPADHDPNRTNERNAFHARCIVIIQTTSQPGTIQLIATSPGLSPAEVSFDAR